MPYLTTIIPVHNGGQRLKPSLDTVWAWLLTLGRPCELLVIDDGSTDDTPQVLRDFARPPHDNVVFRWLRNEPNQGKGFAVRRAMLEARGQHRIFMDADLTYPMESAEAILSALRSGADIAIADRLHADSRYVVAPSFFRYLYTRHVIGRLFNLLARAFVVPGIYDTQAGLKGFSREAALEIFPRGRLARFSFDVELLYLARRLNMRIVSVGVTFLYRDEPSTVHFVRDSLRMLRDMARIRLWGLRGVYDRPASPAAVLAHAACVPPTSA